MSSDGLSTSLSQRIADSLKIIGKALEDYEYVVTPLPTKLTESSTELALSFNGGKDSVVLLHLVRLALEQKKDDHTLNDVLSIYFRLQESFKEVDEFMDEIAEKWKLKVLYLGDFREGLTQLQEDHTTVKGIFMGTRRVDPGAENMKPFEKTDPGWPDFMRINPILDWTYSEIWEYILSQKLPYCVLYEQGYTSIGQTYNTVPNPDLAYEKEGSEIAYLPAYKLTDGSKERAGRGKKRGDNEISTTKT